MMGATMAKAFREAGIRAAVEQLAGSSTAGPTGRSSQAKPHSAITAARVGMSGAELSSILQACCNQHEVMRGGTIVNGDCLNVPLLRADSKTILGTARLCLIASTQARSRRLHHKSAAMLIRGVQTNR